MQAQFTLNQSRAEEITMREDYGCQLPPLNHDEEGFGDLGFGDTGPLEMIRDGSAIDQSLEPVKFKKLFLKTFDSRFLEFDWQNRGAFSLIFVIAVNRVGIALPRRIVNDPAPTLPYEMTVSVGI